MLNRQEIIAGLRAALEPLDSVETLWEAGSAAFDRADEYSDIDLVADVVDGHENEVFAVIEAELERLVRTQEPACPRPILERKIIPQPAFHGMAQRFYKLAAVSEWLLIDFCLRPTSKPGHFGEVERHGTPRVIFDKTGAAATTVLNQAEWQTHLAGRVEALREQFAMFGNFAEKEIRRGRPLDAISMYLGVVLRPLLELVRIKHSPDRHDFGPRYTQFDLPLEAVSRLERLWFVSDMADLQLKQAEARAWGQTLLEELTSVYENPETGMGS
jgi:hypothetical protein